MRFLSVAEEELRAAARRKGTHRLRWVTATASVILLLWLGWAFDMFKGRPSAPEVFRISSVLVFLYCLIVGAAGTADCISRERRDGTLGLLFLTNLRSSEIIAGKLCSNGLALGYSLVGVFPVMALLMLIGGITFNVFWHTALALLNTILFAFAAGFVASTLCLRQFAAVGLATGLALVFGTGLMALGEALRSLHASPALVEWVTVFCPLQTLIAADSRRGLIRFSNYWASLGAVAGVTWIWLGLVTWRVAYIWRDRPKRARNRLSIRLLPNRRLNSTGVELRRRLLSINPLYWLAGRQRVSAPVFMVLTVVVVLITEWISAPYFERIIGAGTVSPVVGHMFAWLWTGLLLHALVLYYAATVASQQLAEDKQNGALELILSTPTTERTIARGLWLAYGRKLFFPVLTVVLVHLFFTWQLATAFAMDPPGRSGLPLNCTAGELLWAALLDRPLQGAALDWHFLFALRMILIALLVLAVNWVTLGWVGRWLGLRMKHPGFAPMVALALVIAPPVLLFSLICYLADQARLLNLPDRQLTPIMTWLAVGIVLGNCLVLCVWASQRLRRDFRTTVTGRFEPPALPWWRRSGRILLRFTVASGATALVVALAILSFYGYQNWHSRQRWSTFQKQLQQRGESLDPAAGLPGPVPPAQNFAQAPAFMNFLNLNSQSTNRTGFALRQKLASRVASLSAAGPGSTPPLPWTQRTFVGFDEELAWSQAKYVRGSLKDRSRAAVMVVDGLDPFHANLTDVAWAAHLPFFQVSSQRGAAVFQSYQEATALEQLHHLFVLRATALLELDRAPEAGEDVLTSLRLGQLARQLPDTAGTLRVQTLLCLSLQPVWEGLAEHRWNDAQLAAFQEEFGRFQLLSDYTNAVHRVVVAYINQWRALPDAKPVAVPRYSGPIRSVNVDWQPRAWWFDHAIELYQAGQQAAARVDVATGRAQTYGDWLDINGLPLDWAAQGMLQQGYWWGVMGPASVSFAQNSLNQALLACALERFRLANGKYPANLEELRSAYLAAIPIDVVSGRPMLYQPGATNGFVLRSVGPDGVLDQAKAASGDDWIWDSSPATNRPSGRGGGPGGQ